MPKDGISGIPLFGSSPQYLKQVQILWELIIQRLQKVPLKWITKLLPAKGGRLTFPVCSFMLFIFNILIVRAFRLEMNATSYGPTIKTIGLYRKMFVVPSNMDVFI